MPILSYISDEHLIAEVAQLIEIARAAKAGAEEHFHDNVIDPFAAIFEISGFGFDHDTWKLGEVLRQNQKTLQNHVGIFHQNILGHVAGWQNLGVGQEVDLHCIEKKVIAEIKNKYSTVSGGKLKDVYSDLEKLVMPKTSKFKDYTAYFVTVLPKKPDRFDRPFTPSDKSKGSKCTENPLIRHIDGASFYQRVTGREHALKELFDALPEAIRQVCNTQRGAVPLSQRDQQQLQEYFSRAYEK